MPTLRCAALNIECVEGLWSLISNATLRIARQLTSVTDHEIPMTSNLTTFPQKHPARKIRCRVHEAGFVSTPTVLAAGSAPASLKASAVAKSCCRHR